MNNQERLNQAGKWRTLFNLYLALSIMLAAGLGDIFGGHIFFVILGITAIIPVILIMIYEGLHPEEYSGESTIPHWQIKLANLLK